MALRECRGHSRPWKTLRGFPFVAVVGRVLWRAERLKGVARSAVRRGGPCGPSLLMRSLLQLRLCGFLRNPLRDFRSEPFRRPACRTIRNRRRWGFFTVYVVQRRFELSPLHASRTKLAMVANAARWASVPSFLAGFIRWSCGLAGRILGNWKRPVGRGL